MTNLNVIDSSGWLEFFSEGSNAGLFAPIIGDVETLIVPTITIYEVSKIMSREKGDSIAARAIVQMTLGRIVVLDQLLAVDAAVLSVEARLPMADSIILATARHFGATLWTQDIDFAGMDGVRYVARA